MEEMFEEPAAAAIQQHASSMTIAEVDKLADDIFNQHSVIEQKKAELSEENVKLQALEQKFASFLEETGRTSYPHPRGTIFFKEVWRYSLPKTDADKEAFCNWLREKGIYEKYVTFNSNSYNSLIKEEQKNAEKEGPEAAMHFAIPGVPAPTLFKTVEKRKGK